MKVHFARIMGIDPGATQSGYVVWDPVTETVIDKGINLNIGLPQIMASFKGEVKDVVIEQLRGYGLRVGNDTFDSIWWSGRFAQVALGLGMEVYMTPRKDIVKALCDNGNAGDKGVRDALIDLYGDPGKKKEPGKLYGISSHMWAALACCVAHGRIK